MHEVREVRVTRRSPVSAQFIAQELSPVQAHLQIGVSNRNWTDFDVKVTELDGPERHLPKGLAERQLEAMKAGAVIRKAPKAKRVVSSNGPSAAYQAMKARAEALARREA